VASEAGRVNRRNLAGASVSISLFLSMTPNLRRLRQALFAWLFLVCAAPVRAAAPPVAEANGVPHIPAVKVSAAPKIDGVLDDHAWTVAPKVADFWCIDLDKNPDEPTTMWMAYDAKHLYFAFHCKDSQPDGIVAVETKRNGSFRRDDHIELIIDPSHRHRREDGFSFAVTARGAMGEQIPGGSAYKIQWRGDWLGAAQRVADGYTVEMAIPLDILRYPSGQSSLGLYANRRHARTLERSTYPKMRGSFDRTRTADWVGLKLPTIHPPLRFMPYAMADLSRDARQPGYGFDLKQTFTNGLTSMLTVVPDFKNIEGDVLNLDFSYNERLAQETRPFFVEGRGFMPTTSLFASQRVRDMDAGFKTFGNLGATQFGMLGLYDDNRHRALAVGADHKLSEYLEVGTQYAGRFDGNTGRSASLFKANYSKPTKAGSYYAYADYATLLAGGSDHASDFWVGFNPSNRRLGGWLGYRTVGADYRPADGFVPERNLKRYSGGLEYEKKMSKGPIDEFSVNADARAAQRTTGPFFYRNANIEGFIGFRNGTGFSINPAYEDRQDGPALYQDRVFEGAFLWNRFKQYRQGRASVSLGKQSGGQLVQYRVSQGFRLGEKLTVSFSNEFRDGFDRGDRENQLQTIASVNYDFTPERGVGGRIVQRKRGTNGYLAYRQNVRHGMDAFIIIGDPNADKFEPRIALKTLFVF